MIDRTLPRLAFLALLALSACNSPDNGSANAGTPDPGGWRLASGKMPTKAEFTALSATCEEKGGAIDPCLSNLGLKHAP
jgi:hypothetical protein